MVDNQGNLGDLEREAEREMGRWTKRLDARPPEKLIESVQAAVRIELNEQWMADQPWPAPDTALVQRVRHAVAVELEAARWRGVAGLRRWISSAGMGSLGAAAMLLLCIGVVWYAGTLNSPAASGEMELILVAVPESPTAEILADVQRLEQSLQKDAAASGDESESLGDLVREMDRLLDEGQPVEGATRTGVRTGVLG